MEGAGVWGIVVAGGSGRRFGGLKQYADLRGRPVIEWSITAACRHCEAVVVVTPDGAPAVAGGLPQHPVAAVVAGGATRSASVRAGLGHVPPSAEVIVVHDAVRPLAPDAVWKAVIAAVRGGADGAVPGVPIADTLKRVEGSARVDDPDGAGTPILATVDREGLIAVQTPQAFRAAALRAAHAGAAEATDDAGLVEADGGRVVAVPGHRWNLKITGAEDLVLAEWLAGRLEP